MRKKISAAAFCFLIACQSAVNTRGNIEAEEYLDGFIVGKTSMNEVLSKCGTPSLHRDNYSWIYVASTTEEDIFKNITPIREFVVKLVFDKNKILKSVQKISLPKDRGDIIMDEEITELISPRDTKASEGS
ncbi:MAG: hypothetical protein LBO73_00040 [Holosporaceae bacterium]|jgi:outer membrane protein assembly factor BamE (lipoprotein component of BamABCDE complex)|nr:hypothetical protein [Holosporaceae bacterium]